MVKDYPSYEERVRKSEVLLQNIKRDLPVLEELLEKTQDHWGEEDLLYRFYYQSFKAYEIQHWNKEMYNALAAISPHENKPGFCDFFENVMQPGIQDVKFDLSHNQQWEEVCRPFVDAFFHGKYFLKQAVKYGNELDESPQFMGSGWAALTVLYGIR